MVIVVEDGFNTWLDDGIRFLKAIPSLIIPKINRPVVTSGNQHPVFIDCQSIDWCVLTGHILQEPDHKNK